VRANTATATTPIKHLVVLVEQGASFDHYFGTYPNAANTDGSPFHAKATTPSVNGLTPALLDDNPNEYNPQRLTHSEALTCDQNHGYTPEQMAFDGGAMDRFVQDTGEETCTGQPILYGAPGLVMDYDDGNTVTALWNHAQRFAMSDNSFQPLDAQTFLVHTINQIERTPYWRSTAVVITYTDSNGCYDHVLPPLVNPSADPATDALDGAGVCGQGTPLGGYEDRCGFGPRLPMMVISPWAKPDYVDHSLSDQASIVPFIEDNWLGGERIGGGSFDALGDTIDNMFDVSHPHLNRLLLDPTSGEVHGR
jgi:phospholipase C